jgi:hypothetical protein
VNWRQNLNAWSKKRIVSDRDPTHVQHNAVEIEKHTLAQLDVPAVIAKERWLHPDRVAPLPEELSEEISS